MMKRCVAVLGFFLVLLAGFRIKAQNQPQTQTLVVQGGTLIDGTGRAPLKNAVIVIEGNRIKEVGTKGSVAIPSNAKIINADGKTILPGFIDTQAQGNWEWQPPLWLHFGVTTVYYNGTPYMYVEKELQEQGKLKGPRMFLTAGYVNPALELMRPDSKKDIEKPWPQGWSVSTPEEARAAVDKRIAENPKGDAIVVFEGLSPEILRAVTDETHKHGLAVGGRSEFVGMTAENGQDASYHMAGVVRDLISKPDSIAKLADLRENHWNLYWPIADGNYAYLIERERMDPVIKTLVEHHMYLAPTIAHTWWGWGTQIPHSKEWEAEYIDFAKSTPGLEYVPPQVLKGWLSADKTSERVTGRFIVGDQVNANHPNDLKGYQLQAEFLQKFVKAGGKIMGGGDNSFDLVPGLNTHQELQQLVYDGITPMQAIMSVTKWASEVWHKDKDLGTIEPGKLADIITVKGDPLADIKNTRNVETVILNGKVIDRTLDSKWKNPIPDPGGGYGPPFSRI